MYPIENVGFDEWILVNQDRKHTFNRFRNCYGRRIDILIVDGTISVSMDTQVNLNIKERQALRETENIILQESIDIAKYKYPIERYGWIKENDKNPIIFYKGNSFINCECFFAYNTKQNTIYISVSHEIPLEELQAIYETAKQIREENE